MSPTLRRLEEARVGNLTDAIDGFLRDARFLIHDSRLRILNAENSPLIMIESLDRILATPRRRTKKEL